MREIVKPAITLFLVCLIVSLSLAFTYSLTADIIQERAKLDAENARKEALASADTFKAIDDLDEIISGNTGLQGINEAYQGLKNNSLEGYVFLVKSKGYGGDISITVGVDKSGKVTGVKIGENKETPGLGAKASEKPFISQLVGITPEEALKVIKGKKSKPEEIEAISGATITSRAVTEAVQAAVDASRELLKKEGI